MAQYKHWRSVYKGLWQKPIVYNWIGVSSAVRRRPHKGRRKRKTRFFEEKYLFFV
jgi:uncharacterized membrane protein YsdA (DUF1294 family)